MGDTKRLDDRIEKAREDAMEGGGRKATSLLLTATLRKRAENLHEEAEGLEVLARLFESDPRTATAFTQLVSIAIEKSSTGGLAEILKHASPRPPGS